MKEAAAMAVNKQTHKKNISLEEAKRIALEYLAYVIQNRDESPSAFGYTPDIKTYSTAECLEAAKIILQYGNNDKEL